MSKTMGITEVFTGLEWDLFIMDKAQEPTETVDVKEEPGVASESIKKEANKSLRGRIF